MRTSSWKGLAAAALMLLGAGSAWAVPNVLQYQGRLTDASGNNVANGSYSVVFAIYNLSVGGSALYSETQNVTVANGLFNVVIGSVTPIPGTVFDGADKYLGIKVGADPEMTPRQRVASVGYALRAQNLDTAPGIALSEPGSRTVPFGALTEIDSVDVTIPGPGYIVAEAGGESYIVHSNGTFSYARYQVGEALAMTPFGSGFMQHFVDASIPSSNHDGQIFCRRVFQKAAAGTYRIRFVAFGVSGAGSIFMQMPWVSATYYPAAYGSIAVPPPPGAAPVSSSSPVAPVRP